MLASRLRKCLLFLTHSNWLFNECFAYGLPSFRYKFNSILLTFITRVCSELPCSIVSRFAETSYLNFVAIQLTGCHICGIWVWGISEQITDSFISFLLFLFTCTLFLCRSFASIF